MRKILIIFFLNLMLIGSANSFDLINYRAGDEIKNQVQLDKVLKIDLSDGIWTVVDRSQWTYNAYSGNYIFIGKIVGNELAEYYSLSYLNTSGKRISDVNSWLHEEIYKNKYDGCYQRPEYYILELFNKGSTTNCLIIRHIDPEKELYNPDDKQNAWIDAPLVRWIDDNSIQIPEIMLRSNHLIFARTSSPKLYAIAYGINPKFFNGPKNNFTTEDTSEYHPINIKKFKKHKKFMNDFIKTVSLTHIELEKSIKLKNYQKLDLAKYSPGLNGISNKKITNKNKMNNNSSEISDDEIKRLKELKKLLDEGILTQEEFNSEKKKILK